MAGVRRIADNALVRALTCAERAARRSACHKRAFGPAVNHHFPLASCWLPSCSAVDVVFDFSDALIAPSTCHRRKRSGRAQRARLAVLPTWDRRSDPQRRFTVATTRRAKEHLHRTSPHLLEIPTHHHKLEQPGPCAASLPSSQRPQVTIVDAFLEDASAT